MLDGGSKALHCGGNGHAFAVIAVDDAGLVNVDADDLAADLGSSLSRGGIDAAAAGEDNLRAALIPGVHCSGDVSVANELVAVSVLEVDRDAELLGSSVNALHIAEAVTDNSGDSHAA